MYESYNKSKSVTADAPSGDGNLAANVGKYFTFSKPMRVVQVQSLPLGAGATLSVWFNDSTARTSANHPDAQAAVGTPINNPPNTLITGVMVLADASSVYGTDHIVKGWL